MIPLLLESKKERPVMVEGDASTGGVVAAETVVAAADCVEPDIVICDSKMLVLFTSVLVEVDDALSVGTNEFVGLVVGDDNVSFS